MQTQTIETQPSSEVQILETPTQDELIKAPKGPVLESVEGSLLLPYGSRDEVRELAGRMMKFHPAYREVGAEGMLAAAQLAILSGANPLPTVGELHVWRDWRGQVVVILGIAFLRRKARENDALVWFVDMQNANRAVRNYEPRLMVPAELEEHGVPVGDMGAICRGYRMSEYLELVKAGVPWQAAQQMVCRTGIGVIKRADMFARKDTRTRKIGDPIDPPNGRTWAWMAGKRSEQDIMRKLSLINEGFYSQMQKAQQLVSSPKHTAAEVNDMLFA